MPPPPCCCCVLGGGGESGDTFKRNSEGIQKASSSFVGQFLPWDQVKLILLLLMFEEENFFLYL